MKTIELTIPTSFQDLGIKEMILNVSTQVISSVSSAFINFGHALKVKKNTFVLLFSSLNKINFEKDYGTPSETVLHTKNRFRKLPSLPRKKLIKLGVYLVALIALIGITRLIVKGSVKSDSTTKTEIAGPMNTTSIDRTYQFPFYDETGEIISNFQYTLEKAELRDEILIQGRPAQAINGKVFLVVYVKIKNEYKGSLQLNAAEYVRLVVNDNEDELLAPEMNSDPVQIQAISTKTTRIGFPIDAGDAKALKLQIGEIDGEKDVVEINF